MCSVANHGGRNMLSERATVQWFVCIYSINVSAVCGSGLQVTR